MTRIWLPAATALTMVTGVAMAAETTTTTTTETTAPYYTPAPVPAPVPIPAPVTETTTERTVDSNGVVHSRTIVTGSAVSPYGETVTTRRTTETTTVPR